VVILVNYKTQSHAEFTCMSLQTAPKAVVIGNQTSGADGNVTYISLPGEIKIPITGIGIYYPDGTPTQRKGIKIDIIVNKTISGIINKEDELLQSAIVYINKLKSN